MKYFCFFFFWSFEVKVNKNCHSKVESLNLVVKLPVTNPYLVEVFKPDISFVKEVRFYTDIIPAIELIQRMANIPDDERLDAFFKCLGSRISLNSSKLRSYV